MRKISLLVILVFLVNSVAEETPAKKCTAAEAKQAEKEVDSLKNWDQVYRSYKRFSQCDDGAIAEGYSDTITRLLADDWASSNRLVALSARSIGFRSFVLRHIDESASSDVLAKIANNARSACPASGRRLCRSLAKATGK